MARYVQSSPWQDAAQYGAGLGQTLGQILIGLPREKRQLAMQEQQMANQQALVGPRVRLLEEEAANIPFQRQRQQALDQSLIDSRAAGTSYEAARSQTNIGSLIRNLHETNLRREEWGMPPLTWELDANGAPINIMDSSRGGLAPDLGPGVIEPPMDDDGPQVGQSMDQGEESGPSIMNRLKRIAENFLSNGTNSVPAVSAQSGGPRPLSEIARQTDAIGTQGRGLDIMDGSATPVTMDTPPSPYHRTLVRDLQTGEVGWLTEAEAQDSRYQIIKQQ